MFHLRTSQLLCRIISLKNATDTAVDDANDIVTAAGSCYTTEADRPTVPITDNPCRELLPHKYTSYQAIPMAEESYATSAASTVLKTEAIISETQVQHAFEFNIILKYSIEMIASFMLILGNQIVNVRFLGQHLDSEIMAAVCLGNMFAAITGYSIGQGILTAMDTLVAQAYTGAKSDPTVVGIILQRGLIIISLFAALITAIWSCAEPILLYLNQIPRLVSIAQTYLLLCIPHMYLYFFLVCTRKFLQGIGEMKIIMYLLCFAFPLNVTSNYFYFVYMDLGYKGAGYHLITTAVAYTVLLLYLVYAFTDARKYWPGLTMKPFHHWGQFLRLGLPGMLSNTEWAFEICAIATGALGNTSLAAQSIVLCCISFLLTVPGGLSTALAVRVGHHLGANRAQQAKSLFIRTAAVACSSVIIISIILYAVRGHISYYFTKDAEVIQAVSDLLTIGSIAHFTIGVGIVSSVTLNALGKQHLVATFNIISYYMIGLPLGAYLMYLSTATTSSFAPTGHFYAANSNIDGVIGIWKGIVLAGILKAFCEASVLLFFIDWEKECMRAALHVKLSK
ncbi:mate-domain-containing protein [Mycotypha africana]|uniref:mate-domain-containing protein n=1 Tax=Mycotypha africana TaxID=64632 RepID=UPI002300FCBD|nr:mate-domain-containing protein [Mycotypha africana]KAI8983944.1 mate-domain-containing protein [Mycotypha africana]